MAVKSITQRWILNSLSIILAIILLAAAAFSFSIYNLYYSAARTALTSRANIASGILLRVLDDNSVDFNAELRDLIENSEEKDKFEITAIDHKGYVVLSSSGFSYARQEEMPDYEEAQKSASGMGYYVGKTQSGEKIMAITVMIPSVTAKYSAMRYVVSMESVDRQLLLYMLIFFAVVIVIIGFVLISGLYFVKSIVIPVREVIAAAKRFATGDMSTRIQKKSDDETGDLTDVINYMADEITASEKMKNDFISSVSHELRTPLTAIKGWSETLETLGDDPEDCEMMQRGLTVISGETERLSSMVEELLDFSRIQSGRMTLVKSRIDLLAEVGEAVLIYRQRAERDEIRLLYHEPEAVSPIFGDRCRLKQVFINIIDNAVKYCDAGDTVAVSVQEQNGFIDVSVSDTGCGISPEDLPKVKTKFYKANQTRRGSGIGLAIADEIVRLHDGELLIASTLGEGTCVTVRLPVNLKKGEMRDPEITTTKEISLTEIKERIQSE